MWILVAEDERVMGDLLVQGLAEQNHTVTLARDGEEALAAVAAAEFDAVVLDVMMPRVNGFEVARRMRERKNHTPILMLTARDGSDDIVKGLDAGADDYLVKPFSLSVLMARLRAIARRSAGAGTDGRTGVHPFGAEGPGFRWCSSSGLGCVAALRGLAAFLREPGAGCRFV